MGERVGERFSTQFSDGEIIAEEGEGKGFASYPWVLDRYERALDLSPSEGWLIHRMLKHAWESGTLVFISMAKVCRQSKITRPTLNKWLKSLLQKGYINKVGLKDLGDNRVEYDVSGLLFALTLAIQCDQNSEWSKVNGESCIAEFFDSPEEEWWSFTTPKELNDFYHKLGKRFNWCGKQAEEWDINTTERKYDLTCNDCGKSYEAGSAVGKYCPQCKGVRQREQWNSFMSK